MKTLYNAPPVIGQKLFGGSKIKIKINHEVNNLNVDLHLW